MKSQIMQASVGGKLSNLLLGGGPLTGNTVQDLYREVLPIIVLVHISLWESLDYYDVLSYGCHHIIDFTDNVQNSFYVFCFIN